MCVILHKVNTVTENDIVDAYTMNPDGFGIMYQEDNKVKSYKGMFSLDEILNILHAMQDREYIAHFRIATVGGINTKNCHPFYCGGSTWMMHNGTLNIETPNKKRSDTWHFAKFLQSVKITNRLLDYLPNFIGDNRLALMNKRSVRLIGQWEEYNGNQWSNLRWLDYNYSTKTDFDYPYWLEDQYNDWRYNDAVDYPHYYDQFNEI